MLTIAGIVKETVIVLLGLNRATRKHSHAQKIANWSSAPSAENPTPNGFTITTMVSAKIAQ